MKIRPEHLEYLRQTLAPLDTAERRQLYAGKTAMVYRWDLAFESCGMSLWICDNLYSYLNDDHIDTALRSIVPPLRAASPQP